MKRKIWLSLILAALLVSAVVINAIWFRPWSIRVFFERVSLQQALDSPQALSDLRLLEPWGLRGHNARLDDNSDAQEARQLARSKQNLATLQAYDRNSLSPADQLSFDTMQTVLEYELAGERFRYHDFPVNQLWGEQQSLPNFLLSTHQINDRVDAEHYIARLKAMPTTLGQLGIKQTERARRGIVAPHFALVKSVANMQRFIATPEERNPLYENLARKTSGIESISAEERQLLLAQAKTALQKQVYPAYRQLITATQALARQHTQNLGAWSLPDGAAFYAWKLRGHTTTELSPEQVHSIGLSEVARIQGEMQRILQAQGEKADDVGAAMKKLGDDPRFLYPDTDAGRAQILADYKTILAEAQAALPQAFGHLPVAKLDVQRIPAFSEQTAPGAYYEPPATDGSRPGVFFANLHDIKATTRWSMRTLAYHEGVPGHHFQSALAREQSDLPSFRRYNWYTAYGEGWALYAEQLAWEMGLQTDPYDQLGRLRDELFRAVRLVVDTGLHAKRWSREQAIDYMSQHTGMPESDTVVEIERYMVDPGQACAYKVGMLKILQLRETAKTRLGAKFDLRAFHDLILAAGPLPLDLLERRVNDWIKESAATR
ncbi:hypothetical protein GCM10007907_20170 [Chitinimonas prasina]|uniref:DUF885 domain-containing protein n=1 Tax=Chitinimonas prasina TaxID=1434937 RepID=A0ABQ5YHU5_9NEIS|nr:DUF885 domain-containing protein [Chitinimonas prasina]GLR13227.1 hypothetical protein GCM10007907_20170 [Chitinimonas prasina]